MRRFLLAVLVLVLAAGSYSAWVLSRPLPSLQPHSILNTLTTNQTVQLSWPDFGEAALGAENYGLLDVHGTQKQLPTASVAKLVTALAVLGQKPITTGDQGPLLTLGDNDIQYYNNYVAEQGSVVPINFGEQISEYQVLQAMMLPSANNMAETLAAWAFGSTTAYVTYANSFVHQLGLTHTHIADASGFSPNTTSTASDLVRLGLAALQNPILADIVSQQQATLPVAGTVTNVNTILGTDGINGIKTGNTTQAGGVFLASGSYQLNGHRITIVAAMMGAPDLSQALQAAPPLLSSAQSGFSQQTIVHKGEIVGYYNTPWHTSTNAIAASDLTSFGWKEQPLAPVVSLQKISVHTSTNTKTGSVVLANGTHTVQISTRLQSSVTPPSWQWRLLHP